MSDLAVRHIGTRVSSGREWYPAQSPTSLERDRLLSSIEVLSVPTPDVVPRLSPAANRWIEAVTEELQNLVQLDEDWDTFGSPAPSTAAVRLTASLLKNLVSLEIPVPRLRGTSDAGVTMEWFEATLEFVVEVERTGTDATVFFRDRSTSETWEGPLADEPDVVTRALRRLRLGV